MFRRSKLFSSEVISNVRGLTTRKKYPKPLRTRKSGIDILHDPLWNKSLAFSYSERDRLGIRGLIPPAVRTIEGQVMRCMEHVRSCPDDAAKNLYLQDLHNRNETLYHRLLVDFVSFDYGILLFLCFGLPFFTFLLTPDRGDCSFGVHSHRGCRVSAVWTQVSFYLSHLL